ncbi:hypothetical protein BMF94_2449, partial [Rhodotorula taiwanensis]
MYPMLVPILRGNSLVSFDYFDSVGTWSIHLSDYADFATPAVPLPEEFFTLFPRVRHLRLAYLQLVSLERLAILVKASPDLVTLQLTNALWNIQPDDLALISPQDLSPFEVRVCEILEDLKHLEEVSSFSLPSPTSTAAHALSSLLRRTSL